MLYGAGAIFQNAMPPACCPTSTVPTFDSARRSYTSTLPGADPTPSLLTKAYRESGLTAIPFASVVAFLSWAKLLPVAISKISNDAVGLSVASSSLPSGVTASLYGPRPVLSVLMSVRPPLSGLLRRRRARRGRLGRADGQPCG